jgi:dUTP pyrophosphatase
VEQARFVEVDRLPDSARGDGGYGSTGGFAARPATVGPNSGPSGGPSGGPSIGPSIGKERH